MENKVLVKLNIKEINHTFDVFIPLNEVVWKIKKMLIKSVGDIIDIDFDTNKDYLLINKNNGYIYKNNSIVYDTDIRNNTELILLSK